MPPSPEAYEATNSTSTPKASLLRGSFLWQRRVKFLSHGITARVWLRGHETPAKPRLARCALTLALKGRLWSRIHNRIRRTTNCAVCSDHQNIRTNQALPTTHCTAGNGFFRKLPNARGPRSRCEVPSLSPWHPRQERRQQYHVVGASPNRRSNLLRHNEASSGSCKRMNSCIIAFFSKCSDFLAL